MLLVEASVPQAIILLEERVSTAITASTRLTLILRENTLVHTDGLNSIFSFHIKHRKRRVF